MLMNLFFFTYQPILPKGKILYTLDQRKLLLHPKLDEIELNLVYAGFFVLIFWLFTSDKNARE